MKKIAVSMLIAGATMLMAEAPASYTACKACHGEKGEKGFAAAPTKVPANLTKEKIVESLNGYKAKTITGPTAAMMYGQAANLTDAQIEELATYIAGDAAAAPTEAPATDAPAEGNATK
ncbi:MAG: c-type cytochrome [Campylobacterales bacterium]|nr:c-type cytochrome [Campylobacterales bacterium]